MILIGLPLHNDHCPNFHLALFHLTTFPFQSYFLHSFLLSLFCYVWFLSTIRMKCSSLQVCINRIQLSLNSWFMSKGLTESFIETREAIIYWHFCNHWPQHNTCTDWSIRCLKEGKPSFKVNWPLTIEYHSKLCVLVAKLGWFSPLSNHVKIR